MAATTTGGGGRARRTFGILGGVAGLTATFVLAAAGGALLHSDLPASRRVIISVVNDVLAPSFRGKITILGVNELGLGGLAGVGVRVEDPEGHTVIEAGGVRARISLLDAARSAIAGSGDVVITVHELSVDSANVSLDADASGELRLARAFESPTPAEPAEPGARGLRLTMPGVYIAHAWVHGRMQGVPPIDADLDAVSGAIVVAPAETTISVHHLRVDARAMPRGANPQGVVDGYLAIPSGDGAMQARAAFTGVVGAVPLSARGSVRGDLVDAAIDVPRTAPEAIRALVPEAPIHEPFSIRAEARGELPDLNAKASVGVGRGTVDLDGHAILLETIRAEASIQARDIDARAFAPDAPGTALGADVIAAAVIRPDGSIRGDYVLDVLPGQVGDHAVPRAALRGELTESTAQVVGTIFEPGARTDLSADIRMEPGSQTVELAIDTRVPDLRRVKRVKSLPEGSGRASVRATLVLGEQQRVDARAEVDIAGLKVGEQRLSHGRLEARAEGALADPVLDATFRGEGLEAGGLSFSRAEVSARGHAATPVVQARLEGQEMSLRASAALELGAAVTLRSPRLEATRGAVTARVEADRVRIDGANIDVDRGAIHGLGEPAYASIRNRPGELTVRATAADLDLSRLAYLARMEQSLRGGHLAFDIDLALRRRGAQGSVDASVREASFGQVQRAGARVEAGFDDRRVNAAVSLEIGKLGALTVDAPDVELGGGPLDVASWQMATGSARIRADLNLRHLMELVPRAALPFEEVAGRLELDADVRRRAADRAPSVRVSARTERLVLAGVAMIEESVGNTTVVRPPPWQITGIDAVIEATIDDDSGQATLAAELHDKHGQLVSLGFESEIPYAAIYREPARAAHLLEGAPLRARLSIPRRKLDELPDVLGIQGIEGAVAIVADVKGTALAPTLDLTARAYGVRPSHSPLMRPADAEIVASYDGARADVSAKILSAQREVLSASSTIEAKLADVLEPPEGQDIPWAGSADVRLCDFPLNTLSAFTGTMIDGTASGHVTLDDLRRDARLEARIGLHGVEIAGVKYPEGLIQVRGGGGGLEASARLGERRGFAELTAKLGMQWGAEVVPALDKARPVELQLRADRFRAAALQPFLNDTFSDLDGLITANTSVVLGPGEETRMKGLIALEKGRFQLSQVGEQFRNARAKVTLEERGIIRVSDVFAEGPTGSVRAKAVARMNGLAFVGANGWVQIPEGDPLPIVIEGESLGEASGTFVLAARMSPDKKEVTLNVDVSTLRVKIPEQISHSVQLLEPAEHIRIGAHLAPDKLALLPLGPPKEGEPTRSGEAMRYRIAVKLRDAEIRRADDVRVLLEGNPTITVAERTTISGQIRLTDGALDIQGKQFEIETGTVTFTNEDPANPEIVVSAGWTAPDGTRVYADFIGPLRTGKVTLRSEPPLTQNEILSLVMFGTVDGASAEPPPGQKADRMTQAVGAGGGIATQGLNRAIDDLTGLDITTRVDTSTSGNPRPEIKVQIARDIAIQLAHVLGVPPPGSMPDKNIASLEWRFRSNWSLLTSFGDRGSTLVDVLWQYRY
jgi:translocation and assembly module TamB